MELYDLRGLTESHEVYSRIFKLIGVVALFLAVFAVIFPKLLGGPQRPDHGALTSHSRVDNLAKCL